MFKMKNSYIVALAACALISKVSAENKAEILETDTVEVVSTTPLPSIGTPLNQVPSNVQAASSKLIKEQKPLNLSELLDSNLGSVTTNNTVANPFQADVLYRGFAASPLLGTPQGLSVFMDGVRVNESFGDIVNWDLIPSNAIANINLIPGSNPLFGLNTLGGALSVHTKSGAEFPGGSISSYAGSWGRRAIEFETGGKKDNLDYFISGNDFYEDGWRDHSKSDVKQLFGKVGWQDEKSDLDLSVSLANNKMFGTQALPLSMLGNPAHAYSYPDYIENQLAMINLKGNHFLTDTKLISANVYFRRNETQGFNSNLNNNFDPSGDDHQAFNVINTGQTNAWGGSLQLSLLDDLFKHKNQLIFGGSVDLGNTKFNSNSYDAKVIGNETVTSSLNDITATVRLKAKNYYYGLYATDNLAITDQLHMSLSGRYNFAFVDLKGSSTSYDVAGIGNLDGNHRYSRFNPAIGFNFNPIPLVNFYGGYNEGMRAPTPVELSCADQARPCSLPNAFSSDPDLKKIVSRTWEGGVRGKINNQFNWSAGAYRTQNSNDIQFISTGANGTYGYFQNVGETLRQGIELGLNGSINKFSLAANYGYTDATFQSPFTSSSSANSSADPTTGIIQVSKGNKIPGIPEHTLKLRLGYEITPQWKVGSSIIAASNQYARGDENNQDSHGKVPGYSVINLDTYYDLSDRWELFAKFNNVFDKNYSTFGVLGSNAFSSGSFDPTIPADNHWTPEQFRSPASPRAGWVGITYSFGKKKTASD